MNIYFFFIVIILILIKFQNVLNVNNDNKITKKDKLEGLYNADRFVQDLDDEEWHVAHLKDINLDGRRDCMGETFSDKARRYRKMLQNDASLVKYVAAKSIPFKETDLIKDTCKLAIEDMDNVKSLSKSNLTTYSTEINGDKYQLAVTGNDKTGNDTPIILKNDHEVDKLNATSPISHIGTTPVSDFKATTLTMKTKDENSKHHGKNERNSRRGSEYMFSSVEYYDEVMVFDPSVCPDTVEVVELEIDQLRSYDVVCEKMIEWRSLD